MDRSPDKPVIVPRGATLPPPRPGVRYVPVPVIGVIVSDDGLRRRVDRLFHWPMIVLALAILPLLVVEFMQKPEGWLDLAVRIGFAVIWLAFLVEFVIKIAIAESRIEYVRRNWLDVIIIVVPLLRPLRLTGAVTRTTRVFKLRGIAMKCARYVFTIVIGLEATERLLHRVGIKPRVVRKDPRQMTRQQLMHEVRGLRRLVDAWDAWYEAHERHVAERGGPCILLPPPEPEPEPEPDAFPRPAATVSKTSSRGDAARPIDGSPRRSVAEGP